MRLPELLHPDDHKWAYELIKKHSNEMALSLWVDMVNMVGVEKAFENILISYRSSGMEPRDEFIRVIYTGLMYHLEKQGQQN